VLEVRHGTDPPFRVSLDLKPAQQVTVSHTFTPLPALLFDVTPGGDVFIDGQRLGTVAELPRVELAEGTYAVEVRYGTYPPLKRRVQLRRGDQVAIKHAFKPGVLVFRVRPGGELFVNGAPRGSLPALNRLELGPGRYAIEVRHGAHPPLRQTVELKAGQQIVIQHEFVEKSFFKRLFGGK
jgi:hypothetical protein